MNDNTVRIFDHRSGHLLLCVSETLARDFSWLDEHQLTEDEEDFQIISVNRKPVPFRPNSKALTHDEFVSPRRLQRFMEQLVDYATWVALALANRDKVVVHCKNGRSRSPCVILAFFMIFRGLRQSIGRKWLTPTFREQRPEIAKVSPQFPNFTKFSNVLEELQKQLENCETWIYERVLCNVKQHTEICQAETEGDEEHEDYVLEELIQDQVTTAFDRMTVLPTRMMPRSSKEEEEEEEEEEENELLVDVPVSAIFTSKRLSINWL